MYTVDVAKRPATYRVPADLLAAATARAAERGETVTDAVIRGLEAYVRGEETAGIVPSAPVAAVTVHTVSEVPSSYVEPSAAPACKHPAVSVDELGMCHECGADVF